MELAHGSRKASKFAPEDVISNMPDEVITNILERLPLQDAVRTGVLSRDWRSKWTTLTHLVFDEDFYDYLHETGQGKDYGWIINRLLKLKGPITKFVFYIPEDNAVDVEDINNKIFVSRKGIKEFTLKNMGQTPLELPIHLFSCLNLKHLKLFNCHFSPESDFHGFPNLLSLYLSEIVFESKSNTCGKFLSRCLLLEILKLRSNTRGKLTRDEIEKLKNLKVLIFPLRELFDMEMITSSRIFQLLGHFPELQELNLNFWKSKLSADAKMSVPITLHVRKLRLYEIDFSNGIMVSCAIDLIRGFPNLETLLIKATYKDGDLVPAVSSSDVDFSNLGQLQLRKVVFVLVKCIENEVSLMKSLLACSPGLTKMVIHLKPSEVLGGDEGERKLVTALMLHRASPVAEIVIDSYNSPTTSHGNPHMQLM